VLRPFLETAEYVTLRSASDTLRRRRCSTDPVTGLTSDFEDAITKGWVGRGAAAVAVLDDMVIVETAPSPDGPLNQAGVASDIQRDGATRRAGESRLWCDSWTAATSSRPPSP
jgi:hypothetical protein